MNGLVYVADYTNLGIYDCSAIVGVSTQNTQPLTFSLSPTFPNPFNQSTHISYQLPQLSPVSLTAYDLSGRAVATLVNETQNAGSHNVVWSAGGLPSGVYLLKLEAGDRVMSRKTVMLR